MVAIPPVSDTPVQVKESKRFTFSLQFVLAAVALVVLVIGGMVGFVLFSRNTELRQQASVEGVYLCASGSGCAGVAPGGACTGGVSGTCVGTANGPCSCHVAGGGSCRQNGESCDIATNPCCTGSVCQNGVTGSPRCEQQVSNICPGGTCGGSQGWIAFKCNALTNGQCHENDQTFGSYAAAAAYAGSCGQADEVCVGGSNNRNLCGSFNVFSSGCSGGPGASPTTNPSPVPSGPPARSGLGYYQGLSCSGVTGWACDKGAPTQGLKVAIYLDTVSQATILKDAQGKVLLFDANQHRSDDATIAGLCGADASIGHGFTADLTTAVIPSGQHTYLFASFLLDQPDLNTTKTTGTLFLLKNADSSPNPLACVVVSPPPGVTPTPVPSPLPSPTPGVTPTPVPSPTLLPSPIPSPVPLVCGSTCTFTSQCPQDHTCNGGKCELTSCVNGASCTADHCRVTQCGSICTSNSECPNDHTCNSGTCKLTACVNGASCSSDKCRVTQCGSSCSNNGDCPNDHTCNSGTCKLTACVNGANCTNNNCSVVNNPTPTPTVIAAGCNDTCINNSDCKSSNQICVDTNTGRKCRNTADITDASCGATQVIVQASTQPSIPKTLPVAGSSDILKAVGVGAAAIILGIVGFILL